MHITIPRHSLISVLDVCNSATTDANHATNILSHVLLVARDDVRAFATDYDVRVSATIDGATVLGAGSLAVHGKGLLDVVKASNADSVTLRSLDNSWCEVTAGAGTFRIPGLPADDFPEPKDAGTYATFTVPAQCIVAGISRVDDSCSDDNTRTSLQGALWTVKREEAEVRVTMVSTDGHRLAKSEFLGGDAGTLKAEMSVNVHANTMDTIKRAIGGCKESVAVMVSASGIGVTVGAIEIMARGIDDPFPDYQRVLPQTSAAQFRVPRLALISAIRGASTMTSAKTQIAKMTFAEDVLTLTTTNPERGEAKVTSPCEKISGNLADGFAIGVNVKYLSGAASALEGETVWLGVTDQYSPIKVTSPDDEGTLFIVMPMRI